MSRVAFVKDPVIFLLNMLYTSLKCIAYFIKTLLFPRKCILPHLAVHYESAQLFYIICFLKKDQSNPKKYNIWFEKMSFETQILLVIKAA